MNRTSRPDGRPWLARRCRHLTVLAVLACQVVLLAEPVPWGTFFHTEGRHIVADANGARCMFRGVNLPGLEYGSFFMNPYTGIPGVNYFLPATQTMAQVAAWGFDCIRLPVEWARVVPGYQIGQQVTLNQDYLALIDQVVAAATERNIYVIIELHDFGKYWAGWDQQVIIDSDPAYQTFLADTWRLLAQHYASNKAVVGFEIMNEPARDDGPGTGADYHWHAIAQAVIVAIRQVDTNHLVFVDGRNYSLSARWVRDNGPTSFVADVVSPPRVVYCPHVYFDVNGDSRYDEGAVPDSDWPYYIKDRLLPIFDWSQSNNVPLFITEIGIPDSPGWAGVLAAVFSEYFDRAKISTAYWLYDPLHSVSELNIATNGYPLPVLRAHLGGVYTDMEPVRPTYRHAPVYDDGIRHPWIEASWSSPGDVFDLDAPAPGEPGRHAVSLKFTNTWSGLKFYHEYLDCRHHVLLQFKVCGGNPGGQNLRIFTQNLAYGDNRVVMLRDYVRPDSSIRTVCIPVQDLVPGADPVISAVVFQNMGVPQQEILIWDIRLLAPKIPATLGAPVLTDAAVVIPMGDLTPFYTNQVEFTTNLVDDTWQVVGSILPVTVATNWLDAKRDGGFYRLK